VCPSLPGYGFSEKPKSTGWGIGKIADAWAELMSRLGYRKYIAQGGDWGSMVTTCIGAQHPEACIGIHLNMAIAPPTEDSLKDLTELEQSALAGMDHYGKARQRLFEAAVDAPADAGLRARRFTGGSGGLDPREVLELDRLQRTPGERALARRDARQRDALLAARDGGLVGAALLGELQLGTDATDRGAGRRQRLPARDLQGFETLV
jgi:pimeloyl-ACP methyl ester carboxylesterase